MKTLKVLTWITLIVGTLWAVGGTIAALFGSGISSGYLIVFGAIFMAQSILTLRKLKYWSRFGTPVELDPAKQVTSFTGGR